MKFLVLNRDGMPVEGTDYQKHAHGLAKAIGGRVVLNTRDVRDRIAIDRKREELRLRGLLGGKTNGR